MKLTAALRARLSGADRAELEQAILRLLVLSIVMLYVCWLASRRAHPVVEFYKIPLTGLAGCFILAIGIVAAIWIWPAGNSSRRVLGMLADVGAITCGLLLVGESGAGLVPVYLFITFGNGFRYGRSYLHVCQFLCLTGFVLVVVMVPFWSNNFNFALSWMVSIIVLPLYVGVLAERINAARVRAEQTLKECLERERGNVV